MASPDPIKPAPHQWLSSENLRKTTENYRRTLSCFGGLLIHPGLPLRSAKNSSIPTWGSEHFFPGPNDTMPSGVLLPPLLGVEISMKTLLITVICAGGGYWLGTNRLVPPWLVIGLAILGVGLWAIAEWIELREGIDEGKP